MGSGITLRISAFTHPGAVRTQNEDTIAVEWWIRSLPMNKPYQVVASLDAPVLCVVADGMGGHAAGHIASDLVVREIVSSSRDISDEVGILSLLRAINRKVFEAMDGRAELERMGTTIAGLLLREDHMLWFNVGDSAIFRYSNRFLQQLSFDDLADGYKSGANERSHAITQAIGGAAAYVEIAPHIGVEPVKPGMRYLICSDGLTDSIGLRAIEETLSEDTATTVESLFKLAMAAGGHDNISIIVVSIEEAAGQPTEPLPYKSTIKKERGTP